MCLMLFSGGVPTSQGRILNHLVDFGKGDLSKVSSDALSAESSAGHKGIDSTVTAPEAKEKEATNSDDSNKEKSSQDSSNPQGLGSHSLHWLKYKQ